MPKEWEFKTTEEDFEVFKQEVLYWQKYFGLLDWQIQCIHKKIDARAMVDYRFSARYTKVFLNTEYNIKPTHREICDSAFHEVCELLLAAMRSFMQGSENGINEMTHAVIQTLCNTLFLEHYEKRFNSQKDLYNRLKP
jgi:hypothetical protein